MIKTYYFDYSDQCYHHGIKGQKWGIRRFQKKDGTLTAAGKKRYSDDSGSGKTKSKHRLNLEQKYRDQGMSQKDAEAAADKRIRTEKIIAITAGVTVAAATAYVVTKNVQDRTDHIIKSGTKLQTIGLEDNKDFDRAFYTAYNKSDKIKYKGMYGMQLGGEKVHKYTLDTAKDVKIVSRQKAADTFADLYKNDSEFRELFKKSNEALDTMGMVPKRDKVVRLAKKEMSDRQLRKAGYDAFNIGLANHSPEGNAVAKKFYDKLKSQGYDAVMDINDMKYSGYKSKKPVIVFNRADKITLSQVEKMSRDEVASNAVNAAVRVFGPEVVKTGAAYVGIIKASNWANKKANEVAVDRYKKEHPNTKMTDQEILEILTG